MLDIIERRLREKRTATVPLVQLQQGGHVLAPMAGGDCDLCGRCVQACPTAAIEVDGGWSVDAGRCLWCGDCMSACDRKAITYSAECPAVSDRQALVLRRGSPPPVPGRLDDRVVKVLGRSLSIREVDAGSCNGCEVEVNSLSNPVYDMERFGMRIVASPRHADLLLVTGPVTRNMEEALIRTRDAAPEPRLVAAMGTCAISGCPFGGSYACGEGVDGVLKADLYIPGCPPHPRAVILSLLQALRRL